MCEYIFIYIQTYFYMCLLVDIIVIILKNVLMTNIVRNFSLVLKLLVLKALNIQLAHIALRNFKIPLFE